MTKTKVKSGSQPSWWTNREGAPGNIDTGEERTARKLREVARLERHHKRQSRRAYEAERARNWQGPPEKVIQPDQVVHYGRKYKPDPRQAGRWKAELTVAEEIADDLKTDTVNKRRALSLVRHLAEDQGIGVALDFADAVDWAVDYADLTFNHDAHPKNWETIGNWQYDRSCSVLHGPVNRFHALNFPTLAGARDVVCLGGQAHAGSTPTVEQKMVTTTANYIFGGPTSLNGERMTFDHLWFRPAPVARTATRTTGRFTNVAPNPNIVRNRPADYSTSNPRPEPTRPVAPQIAVEFGTQAAGEKGPPPSYTSTTTSRPGSGVRERKFSGGKVVANILDGISETSESIDCIFKSFPKDVQKRWSKGRPKRQGDQAGQYGVDGADWKLEALWHNSHKIDANSALECIARNQLEDKLYGAAHAARDRLRPRNMVRKR